MLHQLRADGFAFGLRPVELSDAEFIVKLRNDPALGRYLNRGATTAEAQRQWLTTYLERPGDYYFVVERRADRRSEGLVSLYDVSEDSAEWGRWILRPGSLASVDSVLCILRIAFDSLQLKRVWCRTVAENVRVVSFHDSAGLVRTGRSLTGDVHGVRQEMVEHELTLAGWDAVRLALETQAARMARMLTR